MPATRRFEDLFRRAPVAHCVVGVDGTLMVGNDRALDLFGYTPETFEGLHVRALHPSTALPEVEELFGRFLRGEVIAAREIEMVRSGGEVFDALLFVRPVRGPDGRIVESHCTVLDISARKRAERALEEREAFLRAVLNRVPGAVYRTTLDGRIEAANDPAVQLTGFSRAELEGMDLHELVVRPAVGNQGKPLPVPAAGRELTLPVVHIRKGGTPFRAELRIGRVRLQGAEHLLVLALDVSRRRELEEQVLRSQRLEAVGTLAGGVAHQFNNLLTIVMGSAQFLAEEAEASPEASRLLEEIRRQVQAGRLITDELLAFSRRDARSEGSVEVSTVVEGLVGLLGRVLRTGVEVVSDLEPDLPPVAIGRTSLEQVLLNLALNAEEAISGEGRIVLRARRAPSDLSETAGRPLVVIAVADTGRGMDEATRRRLFDPFFTTKGPGQGMGLGLSAAHGVVEEVGGRIRVDSAPGRGTTVDVILPVAAEGAEGGSSPGEGAPLGGTGPGVGLPYGG